MFDSIKLTEEQTRLQRFALRLTGNKPDADDLLQSTFLRAMEKKHLFKENSNLYSWTSKIMFNIFVSGYRRSKKFESQYDPENYINNKKVPANQELEIELKNVGKAMNTLSDDHRTILIMVCVHGMQYAEVAKKLDIPVGTVRSRLSRARNSLESRLELKAKDHTVSGSLTSGIETMQAYAHSA